MRAFGMKIASVQKIEFGAKTVLIRSPQKITEELK